MKFVVFLCTLLFILNSFADKSLDSIFTKMDPKDDPRIKQIKLEETGCMGTCPTFSIIISADGSVEYTGVAYVDFIGSRKGSVSKWYVEKLFDFVNDSRFFAFQDKYSQDITDSESKFTTVTMFNGKTKTVEDYANTAPIRLWALEEVIAGFEKKAKWEKTKK